MPRESLFRFIFILLTASLMLVSCRAPQKSKRQGKRAVKEQTTKAPDTTAVFYEQMSARLGIPLQGNENPALLQAAAGWLGVPYRYGGQDRRGVDCSGLANALYLEVYQTTLMRSSIDIMNTSVSVKKEDLKEGDLLFFAIGGNKVNHVGVFITSGYFIHSTTSKGVIISHMEEPYYQKHYTGAGRLLK